MTTSSRKTHYDYSKFYKLLDLKSQNMFLCISDEENVLFISIKIALALLIEAKKGKRDEKGKLLMSDEMVSSHVDRIP